MTPSGDDDPRLDPELAEIARLLDETGREQRRDLQAAGGAAGAAEPGAARVDAAAPALWQELDRRRARARRAGWAALAAVAAAVMLLVVLTRERDPGPGGEMLGGGELRIVRPRGSVPAWDVVEWIGPGGPYVLRVLDAETRALVLGPLRLDEPRYAPSAAERERWPARIAIEVERRQPDGTPERATAEAHLAR